MPRAPAPAGRLRRPRPTLTTPQSTGRHPEDSELSSFDSAVERELLPCANGLTQKMAGLLASSQEHLPMDQLADLLQADPLTEEIGAFLSECGEKQLNSQQVLHDLADFASSEEANTVVALVAAAISLERLRPFKEDVSQEWICELIESLADANAELAAANGVHAFPAVPRIIEVIQRHALRSKLPLNELPQAVRRIILQVSENSSVIDRLMQNPQPHYSDNHGDSTHDMIMRNSQVQRLTIRRPAEITIRYLD